MVYLPLDFGDDIHLIFRFAPGNLSDGILRLVDIVVIVPHITISNSLSLYHLPYNHNELFPRHRRPRTRHDEHDEQQPLEQQR